MIVDAHILVGDPHQCEKRNKIAPPVGIEKFEAGDYEKQRGHVVAEAIFAGEQIKECSARQAGSLPRLLLTIITRFAKNLFMRHRPGNTGNRYRQDKQPHKLESDRQHYPWMPRAAKGSNANQPN